MFQPIAPAALQRFVDDEIMRAPLLAEQVIEATLEHLRKSMSSMMPRDRAIAGELLQGVLRQRQRIVDGYVDSLREQADVALGRRAPPTAASTAASPTSLSLVDEDEVAVDVAISHTIDAIRSVAEYEMRELQTFTAALVGDMDVAHDHNPLREHTHARALWAGAKALPLQRAEQLGFMRHASMALAQVLRKAFAGAASRLEATGIEPASHRTLILPSGSRSPRVPEADFSPDLGGIRDSMPLQSRAAAPRGALSQVLQQADRDLRSLSPDTGAERRERLREQQRQQLLDSAESTVDQQLIELLTRLFDALLSDNSIAPDIQLLLARLQSPALRIALIDPNTLERERHPVWGFIDRIAFLGEVLPGRGNTDRERALRLVQSLIDHLVGEPAQSSALYEWAIERLKSHDQHRLEERRAAAAREIVALQALEDRLVASQGPPTTMHGTFDVGQLDTVPAELIHDQPAHREQPAATQTWLMQRRVGDWVRMFMQGRWVHAQLLWSGERGELWLFGDSAGSTTWAVRRRALLMLHAERLVTTLEPRSLLNAAARRVLRRLTRP
jgi:hypothetical protein